MILLSFYSWNYHNKRSNFEVIFNLFYSFIDNISMLKTTIEQYHKTMIPFRTNNWWSKLLCRSSIIFPLTDITFNLGFDPISKITYPDIRLFSLQNNYKFNINSAINLPDSSVASVYDISKLFRWGRPLATVSMPTSPTLFPLMSRVWRKLRLLTIILHERLVRKLFLI